MAFFTAKFFRDYETPSGRGFTEALNDLEDKLMSRLKTGWKETQHDDHIQLYFSPTSAGTGAAFEASPLFQDLLVFKAEFEKHFIALGWGVVTIQKQKQEGRQAVVSILLHLKPSETRGER